VQHQGQHETGGTGADDAYLSAHTPLLCNIKGPDIKPSRHTLRAGAVQSHGHSATASDHALLATERTAERLARWPVASVTAVKRTMVAPLQAGIAAAHETEMAAFAELMQRRSPSD